MSNFSTGKKSKAISDRSGMAFPYREMVKEWNGSFVHKSEFEAKHPQLFPKRLGATHKDYNTQDQQEQNRLLLTC